MKNQFIKDHYIPILFYQDKLTNFPSVNYTSLHESVARRKFMKDQFEYFGITKTSTYQTERYTEISKNVKFTGTGIKHEYVILQLGTILSHLNLLRNWYVSTNEDYAIFCEDDISFESIRYWNFTWDEFIQNLPKNWECIQLTKVLSPYSPTSVSELQLKIQKGRWWGSHSLMKRSYVKKILDKTCIGYNEYRLDVIKGDIDYAPIIENLLFVGLGEVYNFPMLIEANNLSTTFLYKPANSDESQVLSYQYILKEWQTCGKDLDIKSALSVD